MSPRIDRALRRLRQDLRPVLDEAGVVDLCRRVGHRWRRDAVLSPFATLLWFLLQVLHGNIALAHVALKARRAFSAAAYCQARARLPLAFFRAALRAAAFALEPRTDAEGRWHGLRTFLVDGSSFSMPDTPALQARFGQPGGQAPGCGFPVAKVLALFHAGTGMLLDVLAAPLRSHEMARVGRVTPELGPGDVLVGDRGFCSFAHLARLAGRGAHAVFRIHQKQLVDFTPGRPHAGPGEAGRPRSRWLRSLGPLDQLVEWARPASRPAWMTAAEFEALPEVLSVRELRYRVGRRGFRVREVTLATTLLDPAAYPAEDLAELYGMRWRVELYLRDMKQGMRMDVLRCTTPDGVEKELMAYAIAYNLVRLAMGEAGRRQGVAPDRISFVDALRWLMEARPGEVMPRLVVNPAREGRYEPRVRKRRPKQYPLMKKPRAVLRKQLADMDIAA